MLFRSLVPVLAGLSLLALSGCAGFGKEANLGREAMMGMRITAEEAESLEQVLGGNPQDLAARARLLGYYFSGRRDPDHRHSEHALWFLNNHPEASDALRLYGRIEPMRDPDGYVEAKEIWLRLTEEDPTNVGFLWGAASFFTGSDTENSRRLLEQGEALEPSNPKWARELGQVDWRRARIPLGPPDPAAVGRALEHFERAYALSTASDRGYLLENLAQAAFRAGETEKARRYAEEALDQIPRDWNYGNRVHYGNLVLGRIALADGDREEAAARLIAAGETPGSPQLNSFGPDMSLARDLLAAGDSATVRRYLETCGEFWRMDRGRLAQWIALMDAGRTPDFRLQIKF